MLWKPFADDAVPPRWIKKKYLPELTPGKVTVTSFLSGRCPAGNLVHERARRAAEELGDKVVFRTINAHDREAMRQHGEVGALYVDDKRVRTGPPPSYEKIRGWIAKKARKL